MKMSVWGRPGNYEPSTCGSQDSIVFHGNRRIVDRFRIRLKFVPARRAVVVCTSRTQGSWANPQQHWSQQSSWPWSQYSCSGGNSTWPKRPSFGLITGPETSSVARSTITRPLAIEPPSETAGNYVVAFPLQIVLEPFTVLAVHSVAIS